MIFNIFLSSDDVIFVSKTEATPEQIKKARDFLLPDHFYLYETKTPCSGCRGCELEDLKNVAKTKSTPPGKLIWFSLFHFEKCSYFVI